MTNRPASFNYFFSSRSDEWSTPQSLFDLLDAEFRFTLDPCATAENAKAAQFFTREQDGLRQRWAGSVFMNPPYGRQIGKWLGKAYRERAHCAVIVCLIPARTDTKYWHEFVMHAAELRFLRGRVRYGDAPHCAPFPSVVVVFRRGRDGPPQVRTITYTNRLYAQEARS
jgi:phage N-6-adenine-methyltransferase